MKRPATTNRYGLVIMLFVAAAALAQQGTPPQVPPGPFSIRGTVVNANTGKALDRAVVSIETPGENGHRLTSVLSDEAGRFAFEHLAAGKYALRGSRRGYLTGGFDDHEEFSTAIVTGNGLDSEHLVFRLLPAAAIAGTVNDEGGDPVNRARVTLYRSSTLEGIAETHQVRQTMTDDAGFYEFARLEPGTYLLSVSAQPWYATGQQGPEIRFDRQSDSAAGSDDRSPLDVAYPLQYYADTTESDSASPIPVKGGDRLTIDFSLQRVPAVHLKVRLPASGNHTFALPVLVEKSFGNSEYVETRGIVLHNGVAEITGIAPGRYELQLPRQSDQPDRVTTVDASSDQEIDGASPTENAEVTGRVTMGEQLPDSLTILLRRQGAQTSHTAPVARDGSFRLPNVEPGTYEVLLQAPGRVCAIVRSAATNATIEGHTLQVGAQAAQLSLTAAEGATKIRGYARRGDRAAAGIMIALVPRHAAGNRELFRRDQSDSDGSFEFTDVVPGNYTVVAIEDGWSLEWARPEVIGHYVPGGLPVTVSRTSPRTMDLPKPVAVEAH